MNNKQYAKSLDRVIYTAENYTKIHRPFRPVYDPVAVLAARDDLKAISKAFREDHVNLKNVADVHTLLTEGTTSPLFRHDAAAAAKAVAKLRSELPA